MFDSNTILGIRAFLECEEYEHGLLAQNIESWPCGTPIVYTANIVDNAKYISSTTRVYTLMPPCQTAGGVETAQVHIQSIMPVALKPLYNNHRVLTVSEFDVGKFDRLLEFTRDVGGISLIIEYEEGRRKLAKSIAELERAFKYCSLFYYNAWPNKFLMDEKDKLVCVLTFLDLPYCIPLFNTRKVDGVGLSFTGATVRASEDLGHLHRTFRADLIYSNYEDNVFFVDGIVVNSRREPDNSIYEELNKLSCLHLEIGKQDRHAELSIGSTKYRYEGHSKEMPTWQNYKSSDAKISSITMEDDGPEVAYESPIQEVGMNAEPPSQVFEAPTLDGSPVHSTEQYYTTKGEFVWNTEAEVDQEITSLTTNNTTEPEEGGN